MSIYQARKELAEALVEWRDAGGSVEDVIYAIEDLLDEREQKETSERVFSYRGG